MPPWWGRRRLIIFGKTTETTSPPPRRQIISSLPKGNFFGGESVLLHASAVGAPPLAYFWKQNGTNFAITASPNLTLTNLLAAHGGTYTVVASHAPRLPPRAPRPP